MDKKELYFELLTDMVYIINQHQMTRKESLDFDPMKIIPVGLPENVGNLEQFSPFGSLIASIDNLCIKAGVCQE